jgi:hypothetical protein
MNVVVGIFLFCFVTFVFDIKKNYNMTEETTPSSSIPNVGPEWRRLKKSARERFEEPFFFDIGGQTIKIIQDDIGYEHNLAVGLTVWDAVSEVKMMPLFTSFSLSSYSSSPSSQLHLHLII